MSNNRNSQKVTLVALTEDEIEYLKRAGFEVGDQLPMYYVQKVVFNRPSFPEKKILELEEIESALVTYEKARQGRSSQ